MRPALPMLALALAALPALAASPSNGSIVGRLLDDQGRPLAGAQITLAHPTTRFRQTLRSDAQGRFAFHNLPMNPYHLEAQAPGFDMLHKDLEVRASLPLQLDLRLQPQGATVAVVDRVTLVEDHPSTHLDIDQAFIRATPAPVQSRALEAVLLATPGFTANDNGRFHVRGSHGQVTYVVDGVPLSDHAHATHSNSLDPAQVESLEVITGGISAEHGGKPVAVIAMTTRSGLATPHGFEGDVTFGAASQRTGELAFTARGGSDTRGFFVTGATSTSDRFLDPATFDNLHNTGRTGRLFSRFDQILSDSDTLRFTVSGGRTFRDVVNLPSQQAAGQNQRVATGDLNLSLAWQHVLTPDQSLEATVFQRRATARLDPTRELQPGFAEGGPDSPVWARQDRVLENRGALLAWTQRYTGGSTLKAGLQVVSFPLQERFHFALTRDGLVDGDAPLHAYSPAGGGAIWHFQDAMTPTLSSAYVQNDLHLGEAFLALGLRYDRWQLRGEAISDVQPRLGASWRIRETGTILRASFDRLFITPDRENLALSMSHEAAELGEHHEEGHGEPDAHDHGVHRVRPEIQKAWTVGIEQQLGTWGRVMIERWGRRSDHTADVEQFLDTGVEFPIAFAHGVITGHTLRLDLVDRAGWSGYLSLGQTRAEVEGPMQGGLSLHLGEHDHEEGGGRMLMDHDQKLAAQWGVRREWTGGWVHLGGRYDSGLVAGDPDKAYGNPDLAFGLDHIRWDATDGVWRVKPRTLWNAGAGLILPLKDRQKLTLSADVMNLADTRTLYNFLSHRGGTHVYPGRTFSLRARFSF